jgi:hypothetical protein
VVALPKYLTSKSALVFGTSSFHFCGIVLAACPIKGKDNNKEVLNVILSQEAARVFIRMIQRVVLKSSVLKVLSKVVLKWF